MTEPQVWTLIAVFAALMFGMLTVVSTLFTRVLRAEIGTVRTEVRAEIGTVRAEIGALRTEIGALSKRVDNLERDVQAVVKHIFGIDRG